VLEPIINALTKPGAMILDPFMGSGSTRAAAARTKRCFTGIELAGC
jgi:site-specific DNA-methyltransferase (adenine-specific)